MSYPLTREVFELFTKPYRQTAEITFNGVSESIKLTEKNLRQGGLTYTKSAVSGSRIEIGSAICAELTLVLDNRDGRFDSVKFEGAELFVRVGIKKWDAHRWEKAAMHYVPLGYFTVDESPRKLSEITLSALDRMAQFDKSVDFSALSFPMSLYELISRACEVCRVPLGTKSAEMLNASYSVTAAPENSDGLTWRQIIQKAAEISGSCAYIDRDGQLRFGWYKEPEGYCPPITPADRFSSDLFENEITITGVAVEDDENIYLAGSEGCVLTISENFLIQHDHAAIARSIREKLGGFSYTPFSAQIKSLPHYDPLDILSFTDKSGEAHRVIVTDMGFTLNGAASLEGKGETETSGGYAALDPLTQRERDILSKMEKRRQRDITSREQALIELNNTIWNSLGLYATAEDSPNGGKVWYYHDAETLEASTVIYTFRAGGFAWTNKWEGDKTVWQYGFTRDGNAIVNALNAYKIQAEQIEAGAVTAEKLSVEYKNSVEEDINAGLGEVRQEFKAADGELLSSISEEISATETRITEGCGEAVEGERQRAEAAEKTLTETITETETRLGSKIEQTAEEISLSVEKQVSETKTEVTTLITNESERAKGAESDLSVSLSGETERAKKAEETLTETISQTEKDLRSEISATAESITLSVNEHTDQTITETTKALTELVDAERERASEAETGLLGDIDAEKKRASDAESGLSGDIDAEKKRAAGKEDELNTRITTVSSELSSKLELLPDQITQTVSAEIDEKVTETKNELSSSIEDAVAAEKKRAKTAETGLEENIGSEQKRAVEAEEGLSSAIDAEKGRAEGAEKGLSGDIGQLTTVTTTHTEQIASLSTTVGGIRAAVSEEIDTKVEEEADRARGAEESLSGDIDAERSRAETAEGELKTVSETHTKKLSELDVSVDGIKTTVSEQSETITEQGTRLEKAESSIEETASKIDAKVSKGDVCAQIKLETTDDGADVEIRGNHLIVESDNFMLDKTGEVEAKGAFTSSSSGMLGGLFETRVAGGIVTMSYNGLQTLSVQGNMEGATSSYGSGPIFTSQSGNILFGIGSGMYITMSQGGNISCNGLSASGETLNGTLTFLGLNTSGWQSLASMYYSQNGIRLDGSLTVNGLLMCLDSSLKLKAVKTEHFGYRGLAAMESAQPVFSDMGSAVCDENGIAHIVIDPIFAETIDRKCNYYVFLTQVGEKSVGYVSEKTPNYFEVKGEPRAAFDWVIYAPQKNLACSRLEEIDVPPLKDESDFDTSIFADENQPTAVCQNRMNQYIEEAERLSNSEI